MKIFSAELDKTSKILSIVLGPVFLIMPWAILFALRTQPDQSYFGSMIALGLLLTLTYLFLFLLSPVSYSLHEDQLLVQTRIKTFSYSLDQIEKVQTVTKKEMGFLIRIFGNGGVFGYTGYFTSKEFGRMQFWVTDIEKMVLFTFANNKKIVVSPKEMEAFQKAFKDIANKKK